MQNLYANRELIENRVLEALKKSKIYSIKDCKEIAYHMTDWLDGLEKIIEIFTLKKISNNEIIDRMCYFLSEATENIAAASKLMIDQPVSDIFDVGSIGKKHKK